MTTTDGEQGALVASATVTLWSLVDAIGRAQKSSWDPNLQFPLPDAVKSFAPCVAAFTQAALNLSDNNPQAATSLLIELHILFEAFSREMHLIETAGELPHVATLDRGSQQ